MTILAAVTAQTATQQEPDPPLPRQVLEHTARLIREFTLEWHREIPDNIHSDQIDIGGAPAFHPDFITYVDRPCHREDCHDPRCTHGLRSIHSDSRVRMSRAFRRLRAEVPREFDALYLVCRHGLSLTEVAERMTDRAISLGKANRFTREGVLVLVVSAAHKVEMWW